MAIQIGKHYQSMLGVDILVEKELGAGGQGIVYRVKYGGKPKALKVYKPAGLGSDPKAFYSNLKENVENGSPSSLFLWPTDMLDWTDGTFGYIMDLIPEEYHGLARFMNAKVHFASVRVAVDAALNIISAFRILHNRGYSYQDLNDGNFFLDATNGDVLICDNDNVAPHGTHTGIMGEPRYMAPEIVRGEKMPDTYTDRYSLSVILFIILTNSHPLEGKRFLVDCLTDDLAKVLYGDQPIFVMDPGDKRNAPVHGIHRNLELVWPELPTYLKDAFIKEFSYEVMMNPQKRTRETEWQKIFMRFRSNIVHCSCGNDILEAVPNVKKCPACGRGLQTYETLELSGCDYVYPAIGGNDIRREQLGTSSVEAANDVVIKIRQKKDDPTVRIMQNVSGKEITCITPSGKRKAVPNMTMVPLKSGLQLVVDNNKLTVK